VDKYRLSLVCCATVFVMTSCVFSPKEVIVCKIDSIKIGETKDINFYVKDTTIAHKSNYYYINRGTEQGLTYEYFKPIIGSIVKIEFRGHGIESITQNDKLYYKVK